MRDMKNINERILQSIERAIRQEAEAEFDRAKKEMIDRLYKRKDEIIAGISISIMEYVKMETISNELVITVKTEKLK